MAGRNGVCLGGFIAGGWFIGGVASGLLRVLLGLFSLLTIRVSLVLLSLFGSSNNDNQRVFARLISFSCALHSNYY